MAHGLLAGFVAFAVGTLAPDLGSGEKLRATGVLVGVVTFAFGYLAKAASERRERTFELVMSVIESGGPAQEANLVVAGWLRDGREFHTDDVSVDDDRTIQLLDQYAPISNGPWRPS